MSLRYVTLIIYTELTEITELTLYARSRECLTTTGTHVPYGITQCYLPPWQKWRSHLYPSQLRLVLDSDERRYRYAKQPTILSYIDAVGQKEGYPAHNKLSDGVLVYNYLSERSANYLHMVQLIPRPPHHLLHH